MMAKEVSANTQVGRLAFRHEGDWWVAYYAQPDSMAGARELGRILMQGVVCNPPRKEEFMTLMRNVLADAFDGAIGIRPTWGGPQTAPEHERSGSG